MRARRVSSCSVNSLLGWAVSTVGRRKKRDVQGLDFLLLASLPLVWESAFLFMADICSVGLNCLLRTSLSMRPESIESSWVWQHRVSKVLSAAVGRCRQSPDFFSGPWHHQSFGHSAISTLWVLELVPQIPLRC